jgi:sialidase-1
MKHACTLVSIVGLSIASGGLAQSPPDIPRQTEVYIAGEGGYHTYRIPSIIVTPKGSLLAFAEGRQASAADAGNIDLVLKRSLDNGASWSPLQVLVDNGANSASNPCPVIDRTTGTIWLLSTRNLATDRESDIIAGKSRATPTVWTMKSNDDGVTWSPPVEITASVRLPGWTWYATGPGVGIQTSAGRLVIPANHAEFPGGIHRSHLFFSDDGAKTWTLGGSADPGTNESQVVELAEGRLMLNMRNHPPKPANFRMVATSVDGGRTLTTAHPDETLIEPPAQASILRYSTARSQDRNRLLFSNPASARRERMAVRVSYDEGTTWPVMRVLHDGPAAYSSLVVLPDRSIGVLFERGERSAYETITFSRLTLGWLTDGSERRAGGKRRGAAPTSERERGWGFASK